MFARETGDVIRAGAATRVLATRVPQRVRRVKPLRALRVGCGGGERFIRRGARIEMLVRQRREFDDVVEFDVRAAQFEATAKPFVLSRAFSGGALERISGAARRFSR